MNDWQIYVQERLTEWAEWFSHGNQLGLGYPSISREYKLWKGGGILIRGTGENAFLSHPGAEAIEDLVRELAQHDRLLAKILHLHYFYPASIRKQAVKLGISHMSYKNYLDQAHAWIASQLLTKS